MANFLLNVYLNYTKWNIGALDDIIGQCPLRGVGYQTPRSSSLKLMPTVAVGNPINSQKRAISLKGAINLNDICYGFKAIFMAIKQTINFWNLKAHLTDFRGKM